jgi:hypothetical protein
MLLSNDRSVLLLLRGLGMCPSCDLLLFSSAAAEW